MVERLTPVDGLEADLPSRALSDELKMLYELHLAGALSAGEYAASKQRVLHAGAPDTAAVGAAYHPSEPSEAVAGAPSMPKPAASTVFAHRTSVRVALVVAVAVIVISGMLLSSKSPADRGKDLAAKLVASGAVSGEILSYGPDYEDIGINYSGISGPANVGLLGTTFVDGASGPQVTIRTFGSNAQAATASTEQAYKDSMAWLCDTVLVLYKVSLPASSELERNLREENCFAKTRVTGSATDAPEATAGPPDAPEATVGPPDAPQAEESQATPVALGPAAALDVGGGFVYELAVLDIRQETVSLDGSTVAPLGAHYFQAEVDVLNTQDRPGDFSLDGYSVPFPMDAESRASCERNIIGDPALYCVEARATVVGFDDSFEKVRRYRIDGGARATLYFEFLLEDEVAKANELAITLGDFVLELPSGD